MNSKVKAAAIILFFFSVYILFGFYNYSTFGIVNNAQDFAFHWNRINGIDSTPDYPKGYHALFSIFKENQFAFYAANIILIIVLIPILLFIIAKNAWAVLIYFCGIPLAHQLIYSGTYPQAAIILLFLLYLAFFRKNFYALIGFLIVASFIHKMGSMLFFLVFAAEALSVFKPAMVDSLLATGLLLPSKFSQLSDFIELFLFQLPVPIIYFAIRKMKDFTLAIVAIVSIVGTAVDFRVISIAQVIFAMYCSKGIIEKNNKVKFGFILFLGIMLIYYLLDYAWGTWKYIVWN